MSPTDRVPGYVHVCANKQTTYGARSILSECSVLPLMVYSKDIQCWMKMIAFLQRRTEVCSTVVSVLGAGLCNTKKAILHSLSHTHTHLTRESSHEKCEAPSAFFAFSLFLRVFASLTVTQAIADLCLAWRWNGTGKLLYQHRKQTISSEQQKAKLSFIRRRALRKALARCVERDVKKD